MSPQRKEEKLIKMYEILPEGIQEIDKTETEGFNGKKFGEGEQRVETTEMINQIIKEIQNLEVSEKKKENITQQIIKLKNKLEI
jgi:RNA binding exosome subunit